MIHYEPATKHPPPTKKRKRNRKEIPPTSLPPFSSPIPEKLSVVVSCIVGTQPAFFPIFEKSIECGLWVLGNGKRIALAPNHHRCQGNTHLDLSVNLRKQSENSFIVEKSLHIVEQELIHHTTEPLCFLQIGISQKNTLNLPKEVLMKFQV